MFVALERLINLEEGYRQVFRVAGRELLLMVVEQQPLLIDNRCPHIGAPLANASLQANTLCCARHGVRFDLQSGQALDGQCPALTFYRVVYEGDRLGVDL
ncbi:Rieske (2Fe-2S) protein [Atopomonas sediminilitoris]|uniref:Rieske (2Fe-2S) protein n=1 Tax=Atopomonas sediminilitoris TaxID=2919919 RepID=UPI001F4DC5FB|nr:Rieske (2Fe-2S) protein [Atopomonas sediminilitoris]MCJ8167824.1 Rieske (2Fe-2S) protein [Atopomonas sediminilitoris]